jgi:hypothetical protein
LSFNKSSKSRTKAAPAARIGTGSPADRARVGESEPSKPTKKGGKNVLPHARAKEEKPKGKYAKGKTRSLQVATAMAAAMTNEEIAKATGLSTRQVRRIKGDSETRLTFDSLMDEKREDLWDLWSDTIDGTREGIHAVEPVVTIGEDGDITAKLVPDFRTRQAAVRNSIALYTMIFSHQSEKGPLTITMENAKELLLQIRSNKGKK